jgi:hypothetical protein
MLRKMAKKYTQTGFYGKSSLSSIATISSIKCVVKPFKNQVERTHL